MLLSVIIVNYNVKYFLEQCLCSVKKALEHGSFSGDRAEVLVIDNNSIDGSIEYLQPRFPFVRFIANKENTGYARANNQGLKESAGKYVLFLNPDTILPEDIFQKTISFFDEHADAGALGVRMIDGSGRFLKESKRGLPTAWASFCKMTGLTGLFPSSRTFAGYYMGHLPENVTQEVEVLAGAFLMARRDVLQTIGGFDERFFMYAEDIDLSYRIVQAGCKNYYVADAAIIHFKGESTRKDARYIKLFYKAMQQFVEKHYKSGGGKALSLLLNAAIRLRTWFATNGGNDGWGEKPWLVSPAMARMFGDPDIINGFRARIGTDLLVGEKPVGAGKERSSPPKSSIYKKFVSEPQVFCEGKTYSFKDIIEAIEQLEGNPKPLIHASGSDSIVGSFDKNGQGIAIGLQLTENIPS